MTEVYIKLLWKRKKEKFSKVVYLVITCEKIGCIWISHHFVVRSGYINNKYRSWVLKNSWPNQGKNHLKIMKNTWNLKYYHSSMYLTCHFSSFFNHSKNNSIKMDEKKANFLHGWDIIFLHCFIYIDRLLLV